jgi:hypothetical protein
LSRSSGERSALLNKTFFSPSNWGSRPASIF